MVEIFQCSMRAVYVGKWPNKRHDGTPQLLSDRHPATQSGKEFGFWVGVLQERGDWAFFKTLFGMKGWASQRICWMCEADKSSKPYWDFSLKAAWRRSRSTPAQFWDEQQREGIVPSPLFGCPGFHLHLIAINILHALDLAFTQDGTHTFHPYELHTQASCPDTAVKEPPDPAASHEPEAQCGICVATGRDGEPLPRVTHLWFLQWCHETKGGRLANHVEGTPRFLQDTHPHLRADGGDEKAKDKAPIKRTKAAERRCIVPFALQLASDMAEKMTKRRFKTTAQMFRHHPDFDVATAASETSCRKVLLPHSELHDDPESKWWNYKPKFHMYQELAEYQSHSIGNPRDCWSYKDESFMGYVAKLSLSRGGPRTAKTAPERVLTRNCASAQE